jgi:hypothetical protein
LHREPYWNSLAKEQEAYATLIEQLTARIAELEDLTKVTTDDDRELPGVRCACVIDEDTGKKLQECVPHERLRERAEELEAELANERGIKEQFKSALARQEELDHQEKLEARLAQLEEPDSESVPIAPEIQKEVGRILRERGFPGYQENEQSLIGKVLKQGRIACYVGMREFAERIGIKPSVYAAIERSGVATKEQWQLIAESLCAARAKRTEWVCQQLVQREQPIAESELEEHAEYLCVFQTTGCHVVAVWATKYLMSRPGGWVYSLDILTPMRKLTPPADTEGGDI